MNIGVLSQGPELYSTKRLIEAGERRGHTMEVINPTRCYMVLSSRNRTVRYKEHSLDYLDALVPRIGASITFFGTAILRQFEMTGVYSVNSALAIVRARDKLRAMQLLSKRGIGLPLTAFAHSTQMTEDLIRLAGGSPLVIKLLQGTQGRGVVLAMTDSAAESVIDAFRGLDAHFLVQEFVAEAKGSDIRCFVIGDKVVAAMERRAKEGEFRSNLHRGGDARPVKITPEERSIAVRSARAVGLKVAGVDLLRSNHGPVVLEVNSSPGLEGIERCTGKDIADSIIHFMERDIAAKRTRREKRARAQVG